MNRTFSETKDENDGYDMHAAFVTEGKKNSVSLIHLFLEKCIVLITPPHSWVDVHDYHFMNKLNCCFIL